MKKLLKAAAIAAGVLGLGLGGTAQADGSSPAFPFAATAYVGGGGSFIEHSTNNAFPFADPARDIAIIVAGADLVIPVTGYWNIQLGGGFHTSHEHFFFGESGSTTQFQGGAIGFWRDAGTGAFGIEAGAFSAGSPFDTDEYAKIGGVAEGYWGDMATLSVFGGALISLDPNPFGPGRFEIETGFYTGGHATYYVTSNFAVAAYGKYMQLGFDSGIGGTGDRNSLQIGGKVRYLTSISGVEIFGSAAYETCWNDTNVRGQTFSFIEEGVRVMAGANIRLGGRDGNLVDIDRSNAIDTRAWACRARPLAG